MNILIVRLGALGDVVHTIPAAAALRRAFPDARIDWVVDARHAPFLELVTPIDRIIALGRPSLAGWVNLVRRMRPAQYDAALDFQGLMKSAVVARASGARRVIGFSVWHLREKTARPFYSDVDGQDSAAHVIRKNLSLLSTVGVHTTDIQFPIAIRSSLARDALVSDAAGLPIALLNPGAAWPNKRWPPARFGEVGAFLRDVRGMEPFVLWGPGEGPLAAEVIEGSRGTVRLAPPSTSADLVEMSRAAALIVSGDTGPLHIAAAVGTPAVAIFGPTDPARNGPWADDDQIVSRYETCACHYARRCRQPASWCLEDLPASEVVAAIQQRLARVNAGGIGAPDRRQGGQ